MISEVDTPSSDSASRFSQSEDDVTPTASQFPSTQEGIDNLAQELSEEGFSGTQMIESVMGGFSDPFNISGDPVSAPPAASSSSSSSRSRRQPPVTQYFSSDKEGSSSGKGRKPDDF